jgi:L-alanine-DL-glutamate epimerase-like enolase superfamily enzyme
MIRMAHVAEAANMPCMVGCMLESRLGLTAAAHVAGAHDNVVWTDLDGHSSHTVDPVIGGMIFSRGRVTLPETPGIGADVDPAFLDKLVRLD